MKRRTLHFGIAAVLFICSASMPLWPQEVNVDISACRGMYEVLKAMHNGATKADVSGMLNVLLDTPPYQAMFRHYNRPWRPNELPKDVFKRLILSLQFADEYRAGENTRADTMRPRWTKFYPDLTVYERQLQQLEATDLHRLVNDGVHYAQQWLPPGWKIPNFYLPVIPNGGSPAFSIDGTQGYDFLQLSQSSPGEIDLNWLVATIAHESHHLGMHLSPPAGLSPAQSMAFNVIILCIPEGAATEFISGPPGGRVPSLPGLPFHIFTPDLVKAWNGHVAEEEEMVKRQADLFDRALAGKLTENQFNQELREYWLNGSVGRAYVLGSEMLGAIYTAFGKKGVFSAMQDPRQLFLLYNKAIKAKPETLRRCVPMPRKAVTQALAL